MKTLHNFLLLVTAAFPLLFGFSRLRLIVFTLAVVRDNGTHYARVLKPSKIWPSYFKTTCHSFAQPLAAEGRVGGGFGVCPCVCPCVWDCVFFWVDCVSVCACVMLIGTRIISNSGVQSLSAIHEKKKSTSNHNHCPNYLPMFHLNRKQSLGNLILRPVLFVKWTRRFRD